MEFKTLPFILAVLRAGIKQVRVMESLQDMVGSFGFQGTLLTHIQLAVDQNPQIPFYRDALQPLVPNLYVYPGLLLLRCRI